MKIKITNKIEERINEYQEKTGATRKYDSLVDCG